MKQKYLNHKRYHESHRKKPIELAQKTCVQPLIRSNTAVATGSAQPSWSGPATGSDGEGCATVTGREVWCFDIDLLAVSASCERRWLKIVEVVKGVVEVV